jgi:RHS repeat-associated protein
MLELLNYQFATYDNNGNITEIGSNTYTWDWKNRLISSVVNSNTDYYTYDHNNIRTTKANSTATTTYPNMYYNISNATTTKHIYSPTGELLATIESDGTATSTNYIHTDHLGGTNVVTDESGGVIQTLDYYPYGEMRIDSTTDFDETRKFTGLEYDEDANLSYAKQRYYYQDIGKWLSQDSAFLFVGTQKLADIMKVKGKDEDEKKLKSLQQYLSNPQQLNSYSYANNNPVNVKDADGEIGFVPVVAFIFGVYNVADLGISGYDFNTKVIQYPEQFTEKEINQAGSSLIMKSAFTTIPRLPGVSALERAIVEVSTVILDVMDHFFAPDVYKNIPQNNIQTERPKESTNIISNKNKE